MVLGNKPQHYLVVEALHSFIMTPTSMSNMYKVINNLHMLWMFLPDQDTASLIYQVFGYF